MCHIQDESKEEIAYAQDMFETIFKDYALKTYNKDVGEKAAEYVAQGVTYDQYYAAYFAARGIVGDKGDNGKTISGSASRKKKAAIDKAVPGARWRRCLPAFRREWKAEILWWGRSRRKHKAKAPFVRGTRSVREGVVKRCPLRNWRGYFTV